VTVTILDKEGKTVVALKGEQQSGLHRVVWNLRAADGRDEPVPPGEYAARLQIGERKLTKPIRVESPE
jgi:flagellar hook assembly protein FlgD